MKRKVVAALKAECKALSEKCLAVKEELADQELQGRSIAAHLSQTAERTQEQLAEKAAWALSTQESCTRLRNQERQLWTRCDSLQAEISHAKEGCGTLKADISQLTDACNGDASVVAEGSKRAAGSRRWRQKPDADAAHAQLARLREAEERAEAEAVAASGAVAQALRTRNSAYVSLAAAEQPMAKAVETRLSASQELEAQITGNEGRTAEALRRVTIWCTLHSSYERQAERNEAMLCAQLAGQLEAESSALRGVLRRSVLLRRVAAASPVLVAWLVSAWWLVPTGQ